MKQISDPLNKETNAKSTHLEHVNKTNPQLLVNSVLWVAECLDQEAFKRGGQQRHSR